MQLEHTFRVPADVETVWQAVLDPEKVAPCMPGATLTEVDGSTFGGTVKVRMGPISLLYKGSGEFLETDEQARRMVMKASGKDTRGNGTASATVTVTLSPDGAETVGAVRTELSVTGKPAQFGRGMISEVGGKILDSFAECLATRLAQRPDEPAPPQTEPPKESGMNGAAAAKPRLEAVPQQSEPEPMDLLSYAGPSVVKRVVPLAILLFAVLAIVAIRRRSR